MNDYATQVKNECFRIDWFRINNATQIICCLIALLAIYIIAYIWSNIKSDDYCDTVKYILTLLSSIFLFIIIYIMYYTFDKYLCYGGNKFKM